MPGGDETKTITIKKNTRFNGAEHTASFGNITYTREDMMDAEGNYLAEKSFKYEVREVIPSGDEKITGVTYDKNKLTAVVVVSDDMKGNLNTEVRYYLGERGVSDILFTNTYQGEEDSITKGSGTGDAMGMGAILLMVLSGLGALVLLRRRKQEDQS